MRPVDAFHIEYENNRLWENTSWLGVPCWKLPFDAWIMQEIIFKVKPDYIIETGTARGGSALFYASILELIGKGMVITVDIKKRIARMDKRTGYLFKSRVLRLVGDSIKPDLTEYIYKYTKGKRNIVVLDSWHSCEHVLKELEAYSPMVPRGGYLVVEDTHVNSHPVPWNWGKGPYEAVREFLKTHKEFEVDKDCEKFGMTFNPGGFLRRK